MEGAASEAGREGPSQNLDVGFPFGSQGGSKPEEFEQLRRCECCPFDQFAALYALDHQRESTEFVVIPGTQIVCDCWLADGPGGHIPERSARWSSWEWPRGSDPLFCRLQVFTVAINHAVERGNRCVDIAPLHRHYECPVVSYRYVEVTVSCNFILRTFRHEPS